MNISRSFGLVALISLMAGWTGCSGKVSDDDESPATSADKLMVRAKDCQELESMLKADARAHLARLIAERAFDKNEPYPPSYGDAGTHQDAGATGVGGSSSVGGSGGSPGTGGGSSEGSAGGSDQGRPGDFTETNTQVAGIDEADFVKTDGVRMYQLRENMLHVSQAWPVQQAALQSSVQVEGQPLEMFLVGDAGAPDQKLVVYSLVDGASIYKEAGLQPPKDSLADFGGSGGFGGGPSEPESRVLLTKITIISVVSASPSVEQELYFDGRYISSRRSGELVRTVLDVPGNLGDLLTIPTGEDRLEAEALVNSRLTAEGKSVDDISSDELDDRIAEALGEVMIQKNEVVIEAIRAEDWLPRVFTKPAGQLVVSSVACEDFYVPKAGTSQRGVTHVAPLDLGNPGAPSTGTAIVGIAETMYQNDSAMVLATSVDEGTWHQPKLSTYVHRFGVKGAALPSYEASGVVDGYIHGQFSLDEKDGFVRIVTTTGDGWSQESDNHLFTLESLRGELTVAGDAGSFGYAEEVYAVRFVGDTAYVVTFRQTDPLFAIDVTDPRAPTLLGALHIPGFSEYMHPLGANHLLTVGRDADPNTGWQQNLALQVFDVTNRTNPLLAHKYIFDDWGSSASESDHRAFTFFDDRQLLAIPYVTYEPSGLDWMVSSMELFHVDVQQGIVPVGALSGEPLLSNAEKDPDNYYCYSWANENASFFQRGIFMDDVLFGVAKNGFVAAKVDSLSTPEAVVRLFDPEEVPSHCYAAAGGYGGAGGDWTGGAGGDWAGGSGGMDYDGGGYGGSGGMDYDGGGYGGSGGMDYDGGGYSGTGGSAYDAGSPGGSGGSAFDAG